MPQRCIRGDLTFQQHRSENLKYRNVNLLRHELYIKRQNSFSASKQITVPLINFNIFHEFNNSHYTPTAASNSE
jgi:hypothetical protein